MPVTDTQNLPLVLQRTHEELDDLWSMRKQMSREVFSRRLSRLEDRAKNILKYAPTGLASGYAQQFLALIQKVQSSFNTMSDAYDDAMEKHIGRLQQVFSLVRTQAQPKEVAAMTKPRTKTSSNIKANLKTLLREVQAQDATKTAVSADRYNRLARVTKLLTGLEVVAAANVHLKGSLEVYRSDDTKEDLAFDFTLPASEKYSDFLDAFQAKLDSLVGEHGYSADLSTDVTMDEDKSPLRLWLDAHQPEWHPATGLFYDWIEDNYAWYSYRSAKDLSKDTYGFANTPFTWDYYESDAPLFDAYAEVFIDDDEMYDGEDETGKPKPASDEQQAAHIWFVLEHSSDVLEAKKNELVTGDYFIIRHA